MEIEVVERRKLIEVEEKEILRKEKELIALVKRPAESEAYRMEQIAEGTRCSVDGSYFKMKTRPILEIKES